MEAGEDVLTADVVNLALDRPPLESGSSSLSDHNTTSSLSRPVTVLTNVEIVVGKEDYDNDVETSNGEGLVGNTFNIQFTQETPITVTPSPSPSDTPEKRSSCLKRSQMDLSKSPVRRVSFPEDTKLVTLSIDPIDPWKDGCAKSAAEVVSAYKDLCSKLRTKPNDKLVKQLQEIEEISNHLGTTNLTRCGTLNLKGIRLDNKACESLEAIFKRVQFENLDVENCSLEEEGATAILEMVEFYQSATRLNISCNPKMGFRGWQTLCRMLRKTPCLEFLDARRTLFSDQTMPMFGRCLKADPYLKVLHLEGVYLSGRPLLILATAMKYNTLLQELYLGDNELIASDGAPLATMLGANSTLALLDLRNNALKDTGLTYIGNGLKLQSENGDRGLVSLVVWNNGLSHEGMFYLCDALTKTKTLKSLNLGQNRLGDLGVQRLKPGLIRNKSLKRLGLLSTKLGSEGAVALAEVLADSDRLSRIDLRENNLHVAGLMALSLALKLNKTLLRMDLDKEMRKEPGLETVQQTVLSDIYNYCQRNRQLMKECLSNESSTCEDSESPVSDGSAPISPDYASGADTAKIDESLGVVASIRNFVTQEGTIKDVMGTINAVAEMTTVGPQQAIALPPPDIPHLVSGRSRFTITRIFESIGNASVDVANKIANNVGLDAVAMKKLARSLSKDDEIIDSKKVDSPSGLAIRIGPREEIIEVPGVIATGVLPPCGLSSSSVKETSHNLESIAESSASTEEEGRDTSNELSGKSFPGEDSLELGHPLPSQGEFLVSSTGENLPPGERTSHSLEVGKSSLPASDENSPPPTQKVTSSSSNNSKPYGPLSNDSDAFISSLEVATDIFEEGGTLDGDSQLPHCKRNATENCRDGLIQVLRNHVQSQSESKAYGNGLADCSDAPNECSPCESRKYAPSVPALEELKQEHLVE